MQRFNVIALAKTGFIPVSEYNPIYWYVEDSERPEKLVGPFKTMQAADEYAAKLNGEK